MKRQIKVGDTTIEYWFNDLNVILNQNHSNHLKIELSEGKTEGFLYMSHSPSITHTGYWRILSDKDIIIEHQAKTIAYLSDRIQQMHNVIKEQHPHYFDYTGAAVHEILDLITETKIENE